MVVMRWTGVGMAALHRLLRRCCGQTVGAVRRKRDSEHAQKNWSCNSHSLLSLYAMRYASQVELFYPARRF
jgi:hypothetical protein